MKISIITAVYNNKENIKDALHSVANQTYKNVEHIVIDGGSTDGTLDVLKASKSVSKLVSEKDNGIYDALNKGIALASGDVIGFLHSDDIFANNQVVEKIAKAFQEKHIDTLYSDLQYVQKQDVSKVVRHWESCDFRMHLLRKGWMPPHPTLFLKKEVYEKHGNFNINFTIAADYDLILRIFKDGERKVFYVPEVNVKMRVGGKSNTLKNIITKSKEDFITLKQNKVGGFWTLFVKNASKFKQFF